jgi:diguanylate cyclase (GGDEF)-like protein
MLYGMATHQVFDPLRASIVFAAGGAIIFAMVVMIDLDHFKLVNDRHGHQAGDEVLRHVAALLEDESRGGDLIARFGGEELAAILPHTTAADAYAWADRVRARLEREPTMWAGAPINLTASFGVAAVPPG